MIWKENQPCKEIQDSFGFWIPSHGFRIPGTGFQSLSVEIGFWIPIVSGIPDHLELYSGFQNTGFLISWIPESEFPYMGRGKEKVEIKTDLNVLSTKFAVFWDTNFLRWCSLIFYDRFLLYRLMFHPAEEGIFPLDGILTKGCWKNWWHIKFNRNQIWKLLFTICIRYWWLSLGGLTIPRSQWVSGHVVRSSRLIRHLNALTEKAWEDALQGLGKVRITSLTSLSGVVKNVNKMLIKMATNINTGSIYNVYLLAYVCLRRNDSRRRCYYQTVSFFFPRNCNYTCLIFFSAISWFINCNDLSAFSL